MSNIKEQINHVHHISRSPPPPSSQHKGHVTQHAGARYEVRRTWNNSNSSGVITIIARADILISLFFNVINQSIWFSPWVNAGLSNKVKHQYFLIRTRLGVSSLKRYMYNYQFNLNVYVGLPSLHSYQYSQYKGRNLLIQICFDWFQWYN